MQTLVPMLIIISTKCESSLSLSLSLSLAPQPSLNHMTRAAATSKGPYNWGSWKKYLTRRPSRLQRNSPQIPTTNNLKQRNAPRNPHNKQSQAETGIVAGQIEGLEHKG
jgi:hypothetical protein